MDSFQESIVQRVTQIADVLECVAAHNFRSCLRIRWIAHADLSFRSRQGTTSASPQRLVAVWLFV
jgi:hypothetical protein